MGNLKGRENPPAQQSLDALFYKRYFYVYIATNAKHTTLVVGLSGSLSVVLSQWEAGYVPESKDCTKLVYWEQFNDVEDALEREAAIKKMPLRKKKELISLKNPDWKSFNEEAMIM